MVIDKKVSEKIENFVLQVIFLGIVFVSSASMILSHMITESCILLAKYFPFSQLHVPGFQV